MSLIKNEAMDVGYACRIYADGKYYKTARYGKWVGGKYDSFETALFALHLDDDTVENIAADDSVEVVDMKHLIKALNITRK